MTAVDAFTVLLAWEIADDRVLPAGRIRAGTAGAARRGAGHAGVRQGQRGGAAGRPAAAGGAVRLAGPGLVRARAAAGRPATTAQALLLAGFAVKVGLVPFQVWLPRGYAAAPGPARAIMAGVAVNVGFYGLWRTLALLGAPPAWLTGAAARAGRPDRAARHRARRGAARAAAGHRLLQRGEQRADPGRLRRRADRRGDARRSGCSRSGCWPPRCRSSRTRRPSRCCSPPARSSPRRGAPAEARATTTWTRCGAAARRRPWSGTGLADRLADAGRAAARRPGSCPSGSCWRR